MLGAYQFGAMQELALNCLSMEQALRAGAISHRAG